ncbi:hypothetical protein TrST_g4380 [Triparma strigata]|uniref:Uncharacterized protein n=1 Tax=Triparma strigata TaxID=1606541 RepID=A0A9W7AA08_9STRA|nr:hypothetical protein TrST_g4380 [Triparma strigata]
MPRPTFGGSKLKSTGISVSDAAANVNSNNNESTNTSSTANSGLDNNLLAAAKAVDSKMKAPVLDTTDEMDRSVDVLLKKPSTPSLASPNAKTITFAEEGETPKEGKGGSSLKKKKKKNSPETPLASVSNPTRPSRPKAATPLEKTVVKTPERRPAPPEEEEELESPPTKETKEINKLRKKKHNLENKNAGSLEEAKSKQRRSVKERESMLVDLKMPDKYASPLLSAAARGDIAVLESAANAYSRGGGGDYDTLSESAPSSTAGVAALRADGNGVTALHYAAYFHKRAAVKKLLELSIASIKAGSVLELQTLISKRQRFLEEARYAHRQAISNRDDNRAKAHADAQLVKDDCIAYVSWCNNEICRVLRAREMRCEERWKLCLTTTDRLGRTPLMYAASSMGGDDVIKQVLTTGRAALSANAPEDLDIDNFLDGGTGHDVHEQAKKSKKKEKFASSLGFVPPPCNTSKFDKMTVLTASLEKSSDISAAPLFPRDEMFHMKTGQVKIRKSSSKGKGKTRELGGERPGDSKYGRNANARGDFTGGDPVAWLCGRLMNLATRTNSNADPARILHRIFKEQDKLGYGSLEVEDFQSLLKVNDIIADDEVVLAVVEKFRDVRNKVLTAKYNELIDWTVKNCEPIKKWGGGGEEEKEEEKSGNGDDSEEEKDGEEEKEDGEGDVGEEKKEEADDFAETEEGGGALEEGFTTIADLREARCNDIIDVTDSSGRTALHFASAIGDAISVKMLVRYGASCEKRANDNESALSYAGSRIVRSTLLNSLLSELEDAKFSASNSQRKKLQDWIVMLGEGGLNVNDPLGGLDLHTPLHIAAIAGLKDCVDMLLEKRSNVNASDENGWAPIHHCAVRGGSGRRAVAEKLLSDGGCKVDARTSYMRTALHLACIGAGACADLEVTEEEESEDIKMIELLLSWGADIEAQDAEGCTPLHRAAETGRVNCLWKIITSGANLYATTPKVWNCLHYASFNGKVSACSLLVQRDAELGILKRQRDSMRCTPSEVSKDTKTRQSLRNIWESAKDANIDSLVKCIISAQSTAGRRKPWQPAGLEDQTHGAGLKPLHSAILGHGMRLKKKSQGVRTAKISADMTVQTVCLLLDKHCYVGGLDSTCRTPLHFACVYGLVSLVDVLVKRGADVNAEDVMGSTPMHYAYAFGRLEAVEALVKYEADEGIRNGIIIKRYESDSDSDSDESGSEDDYSSDEDAGGRGRKGKKGKKKKRKKKKGRLPRECAGMGKKIFPSNR